MPQAIPLIAGAIVANSATVIGVIGTIGAQVAGGLVAFGLTKALGFDEPVQQQAPGAELNVSSQVGPIPIIYGRRRIAAQWVQIVSTGKVRESLVVEGRFKLSNEFLNLIGVWCEGEIQAVETIFFDDDIAWTSEAGVDTDELIDFYSLVRNKLGTDDQLADADFLAELQTIAEAEDPAKYWTADHRLRGVAYSYLKMKYNAEAFPGGLPQVAATIRGRKVLDLRDGVVRWTQNPALCVYDYLTNARFGRGIDPADIDAQSFIEAANHCDETIFIPDAVQTPGGPLTGRTQPRYHCDAVLNPDDTPLDNTRALLTSCRGMLIFSGGKYRLRIDAATPATFDLTEDNIVGGWNINLESVETRSNRVVAQFPNKATRYQDDMRVVDSPTFREADGGRVLEARIDLPCTTDQFRAVQLAGITLRQSRYSVTVEVVCTMEALQVEVGDVVRVTHSIPGWAGKQFRVMAIELVSNDEVKLQLQEYAVEVYDVTSANDQDSTPDTLLPDPRDGEEAEFESFTPESRVQNGTTVTFWTVTVGPLTGSKGLIDRFVLRYRPVVTGLGGWTELTASAIGEDDPTAVFEVPAARGQVMSFETWAISSLGLPGPRIATSREYPQPGVPGAPTGLHVAGDPQGIRVRWTNDPGVGTSPITEIWTANMGFADPPLVTTTPTVGAFLLARASGQSYVDLVDTSGIARRAYWVRHVTASGGVGPFALSKDQFAGLRTFADDASAGAAGLIQGDMYKLATGAVVVKL